MLNVNPQKENADKLHQVWDVMTFYFSVERDLACELIEVLSVTNKICSDIAQDSLDWLNPSRPWVAHSAYFGSLEVSSELGRRAKELFDVIIEIVVLFGDYIKSVIDSMRLCGEKDKKSSYEDAIAFLRAVREYRLQTLETHVANAISNVLDDDTHIDASSPQANFKRVDTMCCALRKIVTRLSEDFIKMLIIVGSSRTKPSFVFEERLHGAFQRSTVVGACSGIQSSIAYV